MRYLNRISRKSAYAEGNRMTGVIISGAFILVSVTIMSFFFLVVLN